MGLLKARSEPCQGEGLGAPTGVGCSCFFTEIQGFGANAAPAVLDFTLRRAPRKTTHLLEGSVPPAPGPRGCGSRSACQGSPKIRHARPGGSARGRTLPAHLTTVGARSLLLGLRDTRGLEPGKPDSQVI